jgi:hypothetical protein
MGRSLGKVRFFHLQANVSPCAHICRYCQIGDRSGKFPFDRWLSFYVRFIDWFEERSLKDIRMSGGFFPSFNFDIKTYMTLKEWYQRKLGVDWHGIALGGLKMRNEAEMRRWLVERQAVGFKVVIGTFVGHGAVHDRWNGRQGDFDFMIRTLDIGPALHDIRRWPPNRRSLQRQQRHQSSLLGCRRHLRRRAAGGAILMMLRWRLNLLSLGDLDARSLGVKVHWLRWSIIAIVSLIVASQVASSGTVGWVGLIVPHIGRILVGPDRRRLLPTSALLGGLLVLGLDDFTRSVLRAEVPVGVLTALIGTPVICFLFWRTQSKGWISD